MCSNCRNNAIVCASQLCLKSLSNVLMSMGFFSSPYCWRYRWYRSCLHILLILTFVLNLQPATHIQKHFNDSIDTSILFDYDNCYCDIIEVMIYRCDIDDDRFDWTACTLMLQAVLFIWDYFDCWCIWWCDDYLTISIMYISYCIFVY